MQQFGGVCAYVSFFVLLWAGLTHLNHMGHLVGALRQQRAWPPVLTPVIGACLVTAELGIGSTGFVAILLEARGVKIAAAGAAAILYASYGIYAAFLWLRRPTAPCACSATSSESPASAWVVGRAGLLGAASLIAILLDRYSLGVWADWQRGPVLWAAAVFLSLFVWTLPNVMQTPASFRKDGPYGL